jgi:hypothetical protein
MRVQIIFAKENPAAENGATDLAKTVFVDTASNHYERAVNEKDNRRENVCRGAGKMAFWL